MKARSCAIVPLGDDVRLTVLPVGGRRATIIDFGSTDAEAVGSVLVKVARKNVTRSMIDDMRAERDALNDCIAALEPQVQMDMESELVPENDGKAA